MALFHVERRRVDWVPGVGASALQEVSSGDFAGAGWLVDDFGLYLGVCALVRSKHRDESRCGTHECVRHVGESCFVVIPTSITKHLVLLQVLCYMCRRARSSYARE